MNIAMWLLFVPLLGLILLLMYKSSRRPKNYPPGPTRFPFVGSMFSMNAKQPSKTFLKWYEEYGDIYSVKLGCQDLVVLNSPGLIKNTFSSNDFLSRPDTFNWRHFIKYQNAGLIASWGSNWKEHRRFTMRHLRDFGFGKSSIEDIVKLEMNEQIQRLDKKLGVPLVLDWDFNTAITNVIWSITAGHRFDVNSEKILEFHKHLNEFFRLQSTFYIVDFFPFLLRILPRSALNLDRAMVLNGLYLGFFKEEIEQHKQTFKLENADRDLVDVYLRKIEQESNKEGFDRKTEEFNLLVVVADLFAAGGETTYSTLRWTFVILIKYPHIQKELQKELDEEVGRSRAPCLDDRQNLPYLEAFIMEVQRYSNIGPMGIPHCATRDSEIGGYTIPKGTQVLGNLLGIHMSTKYWKDPKVFRPERFLDEQKNIIKDDAFIPFGAGRRQCIGESLARIELFLYISSLLQQFTFTAVDDVISLDPSMETFLRYPKSYKMIVNKRKDVHVN